MRVSAYWKSIIAAVGAAALAVQTAISDDVFTSSEIVSSVLAVLVALGVYITPNTPTPSGTALFEKEITE